MNILLLISKLLRMNLYVAQRQLIIKIYSEVEDNDRSESHAFSINDDRDIDFYTKPDEEENSSQFGSHLIRFPSENSDKTCIKIRLILQEKRYGNDKKHLLIEMLLKLIKD